MVCLLFKHGIYFIMAECSEALSEGLIPMVNIFVFVVLRIASIASKVAPGLFNGMTFAIYMYV